MSNADDAVAWHESQVPPRNQNSRAVDTGRCARPASLLVVAAFMPSSCIPLEAGASDVACHRPERPTTPVIVPDPYRSRRPAAADGLASVTAARIPAPSTRPADT